MHNNEFLNLQIYIPVDFQLITLSSVFLLVIFRITKKRFIKLLYCYPAAGSVATTLFFNHIKMITRNSLTSALNLSLTCSDEYLTALRGKVFERSKLLR